MADGCRRGISGRSSLPTRSCVICVDLIELRVDEASVDPNRVIKREEPSRGCGPSSPFPNYRTISFPSLVPPSFESFVRLVVVDQLIVKRPELT